MVVVGGGVCEHMGNREGAAKKGGTERGGAEPQIKVQLTAAASSSVELERCGLRMLQGDPCRGGLAMPQAAASSDCAQPGDGKCSPRRRALLH